MELWLAPRAGIWTRSLPGWDAFRAAVATATEPADRPPEPVPDLLPAREGRRAPIFVRLALEAASQACRENGVARSDVATVFASAMGDSQITDYMCRTLAGPAPMLSPTKFHNSVHNAASGYWGIGAANRRASSAIAAREDTFGAGLLEAGLMAVDSRSPVLFCAYDVPAPEPLTTVSPNRQPFGCGLILSTNQPAADWRAFRLETTSRSDTTTDLPPWLATLMAENSTATGLPLLRALAGSGPADGQFGVGLGTALRWDLA